MHTRGKFFTATGMGHRGNTSENNFFTSDPGWVTGENTSENNFFTSDPDGSQGKHL